MLGETDLGLKSDTSRDKLARTLKAFTATIPWKRLLERACTTVLKAHRKGEPVFFRELARNVWELERVSDPDGPARIVLVQKKNNFGPLR